MASPSNKTSYGPYFWLAATSFIVPLFVAYAVYRGLEQQTTYTPTPNAAGVDHGIWDGLLKKHVQDGKIDYLAIANDPWFGVYLKQLGQAEPEKLASDDERLALYLNAYNALVIDGVYRHRVRDSVLNVSENDVGFFDLKEHILAGQTLSLNELENDWIRAGFGDARIHAALVCAALGCPPLRREAYVGATLQRQLEDQTRQFANDPYHVSYDAASDTIRVNSILDWYREDWNEHGGAARWLVDYVDDPVLKQKLTDAAMSQATLTLNEYDWTLNSQVKLTWQPGKSSGQSSSTSGQFGSGSIPTD